MLFLLYYFPGLNNKNIFNWFSELHSLSCCVNILSSLTYILPCFHCSFISSFLLPCLPCVSFLDSINPTLFVSFLFCYLFFHPSLCPSFLSVSGFCSFNIWSLFVAEILVLNLQCIYVIYILRGSWNPWDLQSLQYLHEKCRNPGIQKSKHNCCILNGFIQQLTVDERESLYHSYFVFKKTQTFDFSLMSTTVKVSLARLACVHDFL